MNGLFRGILLLSALSVVACGSEGGVAASPQTRGERLFARHCSSCHSTSPDTIIVGPSLAGVAVRAGERVEGMDARTYLQTSILAPGDHVVEGFRDVMPRGFREALSAEEVEALVDYLMTLN